MTNSSSKYRTTSNVIVNAYHCRLLYESQNLAVLESSLGCKDAFMEFYSFYGDPMRYFAAGWCIGHSKCHWKLFFRNVIPPDCAKMLISGVQQCKQLSNSLKVCELYIGNELLNFSCSFDSLHIVDKLRQSICFDLHRIFLYVDVTSQVWSCRNALNVLPFFGRIVSENGSLSEVEVSVSAGNDLFCSPIGEVTDHSFWPFCIRSESKRFYLPQFFEKTFLERSLRHQPRVVMLQPCSQLLHAVLQLKSLKTLTLHRDICLCLTTSDISLVRNCSLESLTIMCYYDYIYNFGELTSALSSCISLKELNFCINFYFEGYSVHTNKLLSKLDLTSLSLQNCNLTDGKGALVLKPLALKTNLSTLKIAENDLGEKSCAVIADILKGTTLKKLDISECKLPLNGIINIMEALSLNTSLTDLNIGGNECTGGSGALSSMLCTNVTLTTLEMDNCSFTRDETSALIEIFARNTNTTLKTLVLSNNRFSEQSVEMVIRENTTLHYLTINADCQYLNYLGPTIISALGHNKTLKMLRVQMQHLYSGMSNWLEKCAGYDEIKDRITLSVFLMTIQHQKSTLPPNVSQPLQEQQRKY